MRRLLPVLTLLLVTAIAWAGAGSTGDVLTEDEMDTACAEMLPKQLECKNEFCAAMVKIRTRGNKNADVKALEAKCVEEISVDGTGDLATRKARCVAWSKDRPKMSIPRSDANELNACWTKATCQARVDCWAPKMSKMMTKMMDAAAPKKK